MITLFNFFTGLRFHYFITFEIWVSGRMESKATRCLCAKNKKYMVDLNEISTALNLTPTQSEVMKSPNAQLMVTGISYLGYFKRVHL